MKALTWTIMGSSVLEIVLTILSLLAVVVVLELLVYLVARILFRNKHYLVIMLIAPAVLGLLLLVVYPIFFEVTLAFSNMNLAHFRKPDYGLEYFFGHFVRIFTQPILKQATFLPIFLQTITWTVIQVSFHTTLGMIIAMLLNRNMKIKGFYRTLIVIPWAVPQVIACLTWRGEFHQTYGFVNIMLRAVGLPGIEWKASAFWNVVAMNITNIWLGVPFMMIICLGGLQSISREYYEAAEIDGASWWQQFKNITMPLMQPVLSPAVILGVIWTFNNFNVPFFINEQRLESSDILVTALFRAAFEYNNYGFAAAFAIVIFFILFGFSIFYIRTTGALKGVRA